MSPEYPAMWARIGSVFGKNNQDHGGKQILAHSQAHVVPFVFAVCARAAASKNGPTCLPGA
jgi:hypothetical protein